MTDRPKANVSDMQEENLETREESLIEFPASIGIKVMGHNNAEFKNEIQSIVEKLISSQDVESFKETLSKNGRFLSITVTAMFYAKVEIDRVYQALTDSKKVLMAL